MSGPRDARTVPDDQVLLWYCEKCHKSGALYVAGANVYSAIDAHQAKAPECGESIKSVHIARPGSWYTDTFERVTA